MSDIALRDSQHDLMELMLDQAMLDGRPFFESRFWPCETVRYDGSGTVLLRRRWPHSEDTLTDLGTTISLISLGGGEARARIAAPTQRALESSFRQLLLALPKTDVNGERKPLAFWTDTANGPRRITRMISVPTWEEISANYPSEIAQELACLTEFRPSSAGQLVLWRGESGTGKTWAVRALVREWSPWARFHYVTDPDAFFGHNPSYMLSVLLDDESGPAEVGDGQEASLWKILLLEDAGEMVSRDARERAGQGLSRLLNLVDGLIGQGLRVLCLLTTNEELGSLHPAISRPGRCAASVEFRSLSQEEAQTWLDERSADGLRATGHLTIADLYALLAGRDARSMSLVGFAESKAS